MRVHQIVESLCKKYTTRDPYELAACKNIRIIELPLGGIKGYYSKCYNQKFIHVNCDLPRNDQKFTCAHELGHSILHPNANTPFLRTSTLLPVGRYEREANYFATDLLISDDDIKELLVYSIPEIAAYFNLPEQFINYRLGNLLI